MKDLLDYGTAIERLRERKGLSREELARGSGVSYSYLSEVERGLKRPSTDVLARLATALDMLPSDLLRYVEEVSAKGHGLFRKRVLEAPLHEHAGEVPELAVRRTLLRPAGRAASALDPEDLKILISLVGRLGAARKRQP